MKKLMPILMLVFMAIPAMAQEHDSNWLKPIEGQYVCMVNNQSYSTPQIAVEVEGKTYFGCCSMCKTKLEKSSTIRTATDPVSGSMVDKATAIIGTGPDRKVYYFENEENFQAFANGPIPETNKHKH